MELESRVNEILVFFACKLVLVYLKRGTDLYVYLLDVRFFKNQGGLVLNQFCGLEFLRGTLEAALVLYESLDKEVYFECGALIICVARGLWLRYVLNHKFVLR